MDLRGKGECARCKCTTTMDLSVDGVDDYVRLPFELPCTCRSCDGEVVLTFDRTPTCDCCGQHLPRGS